MDSRCTGPSSTIMWDTHSPKSRESPLYYGPHCYTHRRRGPPPRTRGGPERTSATPRPTTRVRDRSHAHANRTRGGPDRIHRQLVTGRRYTGLTVTFSRPTEAPLEPPTGSEEQSSRSFPTSTVSLSRLGLAHHPHRAGAGAGSALTCTTEAAALTQRSHLYRLRCTRLPALRTRAKLATAPPRRRHPGPCGRRGRRYRRWFGPPQPAGTMRIGHPCPSGRMCRSPWPQLFSVRTESHLREPGRPGMGGRPWLGRRDAPHRWPGQCQHARRWPRADTATAVSSQLRRRRPGWVLPAPRERGWLPRASEWAFNTRDTDGDLPKQPRTGSH